MAEDMTALSDEELLVWKPRMGNLTVGDKVAQAELLKRQANLLFKRGEPRRALPVYAKVFAYVNGLSVQGDEMAQYASSSANMSASPAQGEQIRLLKVAAWSNMAFCHLKMGSSPDKALELCDKVLTLEPTHSKARFRKAQVMMQQSNFDRAHELLTALLEEEPKNAAVRAEMRQLLELKRAYDAEAKAKEKSVYGNMFK